MDLTAFLPQFQSGVLIVVAFIVALSVIVAIHEYGHYIVGRWSGIHAEVFSLGFGPVLWSRRDKRGTKWQIALIPMGGYVRFKGDADAASGPDGEVLSSLSDEERRSTMHGAPLWARAATVAAGPFFNFALSIIIFSTVILSEGVVGDRLIVGEMRNLPAADYTLQEGDVVLGVEGVDLPDFGDGEAIDEFIDGLPPKTPLEYRVEREGEQTVASGPFLYPPIVLQVSPQSAAYDIGLEQGDLITAIDGTPIEAFRQLKTAVEGSEGRALQLKVWRDGELLDFALVPRRVDEPQAEGGFKTEWRIGIAGGTAFEPATESVGIGTSISRGVTQTWAIMQSSISGLWHMITGAISTCNMSGPIGIAQTSGAMASQGATSFIWFIAALSTAVGLLNLFPIPVLDGGHLVFHAYEAVVGRPPSDNALRILMGAGLTLILGVMIFALSNDLFCP